jgi:hypothetical protein
MRCDAARRPLFCTVSKISKDRKKVTLRWDLGEKVNTDWRIDYSRPVPNKPNYYYQSPHDTKKHLGFGNQVVDMDQVLNVNAYHVGDYEMFLCDAALKGAYLEWAPQLLACERFLFGRC